MKKVLIFLIKGYQKIISPKLEFFNIQCKYYPSCSEYTKLAILKYGAVKGSFLGMKRILKCNPFSKGGIDLLK